MNPGNRRIRPVRCPRCNAPTIPDAEGKCQICGFNIQKVHVFIRKLYLTLTAVSVSTIFIGVIVFIAEQYGPPQPTGPAYLIWVFLAIAAGIAVAAAFLCPIVKMRPGAQALAGALIIMAALAESITLMGLVLYFLLGSIKWFVVFLGISWAAFTMIGIRLSDVIVEYERRLVRELENA